MRNSAKVLVAWAVVTAFFLGPFPAAEADEFPSWAYPVPPPAQPHDATTVLHVPGSALGRTEAQIESYFDPPDWFPDTHPAMPSIVAHGHAPAVIACMKCHLPNGAGHPESADLAALSVGYIKGQMAAFKDGSRNGILARAMGPISHAVSDAEITAAAQYYAGLVDPVWTKVVETDTVSKTYVSAGSLRLADPAGGTEALGDRIIELPEDPKSAVMLAMRSGFLAYVPLGSVAKGKDLVTTGASGRSIPCAACHGTDLLGVDDTPHISGRSPLYVFRQLNDFKTGRRQGGAATAMQQVAANLSQTDMISIAAYLATLKP